MPDKDIRWVQRFNNFKKALSQLSKFVDKGDALNELEEQGLIKAFEYTFELAWNCMKDFYENQGETELQGSRDTIQLAFKRGLIQDGDSWMQMLKDRNRTSMIYEDEILKTIAYNIKSEYFTKFVILKSSFESIVLHNPIYLN